MASRANNRRANDLGTNVTILREKASRQMYRIGKTIYQWSKQPGKPKTRTIIFIVGCQRSGTTMMTRIFERDINTKVYSETSRLSSLDAPKRLLLNPLDSVKKVIEQDRAPMVILKPLVESQRTPELLDYFEGSKAIWLYRHYKDVAASYVKMWGEGHSAKDLQIIVDKKANDWRVNFLPESVIETVCEHYSETMDSHDASALYWYVRNTLYYSRQLDSEPRVMLCKYEELVASPTTMLRHIYQFAGHEYPGEYIVRNVHDSSVSKGNKIKLSPEIERLCCELHEKLDRTFYQEYHK